VIPVTPASADRGAEVAVDGFDDAEGHLVPAIGHETVEVLEKLAAFN